MKNIKTYFASLLQPEDFKGGGHDHPLLLVIWRRNSLEGLEPLEGGLSPLGLVGHHAAHSAPKDLSGRPEVERASGGLDVAAQPQELQVLELVSVEVAAHVDALAPHHDDLVAVQDEFGDDGGQTAHQMATAIDHDRLKMDNLNMKIGIRGNIFVV